MNIESIWKKIKLGDIVTFQRGFDITKKEQNPGPIDVISSSGFNSKHDEYKVKGPGVVIGRKGSIGTVFYTDKNFWPHDTTLWVKDFKGNSPKFVYYFLKTLNLERYDVGASNPTLNRNHIHKIDVKWPKLEFQKHIVKILSAFDDLIENNTRRIEILEEMARLIYREWFVHFRFPGHEDVQMVDSELGKIPEGWEVKPVDEAFDAIGGGTPKTKVLEYWEGGNLNWYTPSDLTSNGRMFQSGSERKITQKGLENSSAKMFPPYSVMMTSRATLGVIAFNSTPASVNQGFIVCIPNEKVSGYQIYYWIEQNLEKMINAASGATYKEITKTNFRKMKFPVLDENLNNKFVKTVEPVFKQIENLENKSKILKEIRDLLLPKLISGDIGVGNK